MKIPFSLYDPWFISLATLALTLMVSLLVARVGNRIRSLWGNFSGTYLAITGPHFSPMLVLELVKCFHIGNRIKRKILGVCFAQLDDDKLSYIADNEGVYRFEGSVDERLFVLSYFTVVRGAKGTGTLTLQADGSGRVFSGGWSGFDEGQVVTSSPCMWIKVNKELYSRRNRQLILREAERVLSEEQNPWTMNYFSYFPMKGGTGKSRFLAEYYPKAKSRESKQEKEEK
jgi:hypothetical protein